MFHRASNSNNRRFRQQIGKETLDIVERGSYEHSATGRQCFSAQLQAAVNNTECLSETELDELYAVVSQSCVSRFNEPNVIEVVPESTLCACKRLILDEDEHGVVALNFASAKHAGGGWLSGAQAQEESLARASALYKCLISQYDQYYSVHQKMSNPVYSDAIIYSPDVPVIRDDADMSLLPRYYSVAFVSAAAPNTTVIKSRCPERLVDLPNILSKRIAKILSVAVSHAHDVIVLGAWGCGAFGNDANLMANCFAQHLTHGGQFARAFKRVVFAIPSAAKDEGRNLKLFRLNLCNN